MNIISKMMRLTALMIWGIASTLSAQGHQIGDDESWCYLDPSPCCRPFKFCFPSFLGNFACCNGCSELYLGTIGYGTSLKVEGSSIGLDDYYGDDCDDHKITGTLWGMVLGYTYRQTCGFYFNTEFEWAVGKVSREKHYIDALPDRYLHDYFWTNRFGYTFNCLDCYQITPYGGFGLRYSRQDLSDSGLEVSYRDWFGIIGGRIDRTFCNCWSVGFNGQWYIPFSSRVKLEDYCGHFHLDERYGYQLDLPVTYTTCWCGTALNLTLSPFFRKFEDGKSGEKTFDIETVQVPKLRTEAYGAKFYLSYCF